MFNLSTKSLVINAMLAALYFVLTIASAPIAYGGVQFRISEILILLAFFNSDYILGIAFGTFIANYVGPFGLPDAIFGTLVSIIAMLLIAQTRKILGKKPLALFVASLFPVVLNAIYVAIIIMLVEQAPWNTAQSWEIFLPLAISVAFGEFVVVSIIGVIAFWSLQKNSAFQKIL